MQIALTKKLAEAMGIKPSPVHKVINPLFTWTANWTKVWDNRRTEDMLVLVNNATRFTVAIYQVKRKDMKNVGAEMLTAAIRNTLLALNLNVVIIDEYLQLSGDVEFVVNSDRQFTAWVNKAGTECAYHVGNNYNGVAKMFSDTVGVSVNYRLVGYTNNQDGGFIPYKKMFDALAELTGKPVYKYRAFELLVTLDLEIYQAMRRLIFPADIELSQLHKILQQVFHWNDYHLHNWNVMVLRIFYCLLFDRENFIFEWHFRTFIKAGKPEKDAFYAWSEKAREEKARCVAGEISLQKFSQWLKTP